MTPLLLHPLWQEIRPYVHIQNATANAEGRVRLEIRRMPEPLQYRALALEVHCPVCGCFFRPIRQRDEDAARGKPGTAPKGTLYFAAVCSPSTGRGCCKGKIPSRIYDAIQADVEAWQEERPQVTAAEAQMSLGLLG